MGRRRKRKKTGGRKSEITEELVEAILSAYESGLTLKLICHHVDLHESTVWRWLQAGEKGEGNPLYHKLFTGLRARKSAEAKRHLDNIRDAAVGAGDYKRPDWRASEVWLQKCLPLDYGKPPMIKIEADGLKIPEAVKESDSAAMTAATQRAVEHLARNVSPAYLERVERLIRAKKGLLPPPEPPPAPTDSAAPVPRRAGPPRWGGAEVVDVQAEATSPSPTTSTPEAQGRLDTVPVHSHNCEPPNDNSSTAPEPKPPEPMDFETYQRKRLEETF